jgi:hypothetical protein
MMMTMPRRYPHGVVPTKCTAVAKHTGKPCRRWATVGSMTCYHHGGNAGQVIDRAERRIIEMQLEEVAPRKSRRREACLLALDD